MRFKAVSSVVFSPSELEPDFQTARDIGKVRLGRLSLYFPKFSSSGYLPYTAVSRAWLRQEEVNAGMCCGRVNLDRFFLMVQDKSGTVHKAEVLSKEVGKQALSHISGVNPAVELGYRKEEPVS